MLIVVSVYSILDFTPAFCSDDNPVIKKVEGEYILVLPKMMKKALQNYDPIFTSWRQNDYLPSLLDSYTFLVNQAPFAVIGDFNGDKVLDVVSSGHNKDNDLLVCILSNGRKFKVVEIERYPLTDPKKEWYGMGDHREHGLWVYLTFISQGKIKSPYEKRSLKLKTDAFEWNAFEKASVLYYFKGDEFLKYQTND